MADIMLVLLIIFMITTPLLQSGITVNLPRGANLVEMPEAEDREAIMVGMDVERTLFIWDEAFNDRDGLKKQIEYLKDFNAQGQAYFKCDAKVSYDSVVASLELIKEAGLDQIGLVIDEK
jgi:biopolymer transport protein TolR